MSLFSAIGHLAHEVKAARARYLTERQLGSLPFEIQKDIGWPPVTNSSPVSKGVGHWAGAK
ncbi:MAG: hypothetical protein AB7P20_10300 [Rhizobiaceae bacterium]